MTKDYLIYPSALEKIKASGIEERVIALKNSEEGLGYIRLEYWSQDIARIVNSLKSDGFYKHIPSDFKQQYIDTMNGMLANPKNYFWRVETSTGDKKTLAKLEDVDLFSGSIASLILSPDEIWDFKKFGFSSASEFISTIGIYVLNESHHSFHPGYVWSTKRTDGAIIVTEITGDSNADLRIFQHDVTNYNSFDPFGNKIEFKPTHYAGAICGYHSTEPTLLAITLKYIDQLNIDVDFKKDNAKQLFEWAGTINEEELVAATPFGTSLNVPLYFVGHPIPIPVLDENNSTTALNTDSLGVYGEGYYSPYISNKGNLVFSKEQNASQETNIPKEIHASFTPSDAEHIIKGLFYQSIKHLGRTQPRDLANLINYRLSPDFEIEQKKLKEYYDK